LTSKRYLKAVTGEASSREKLDDFLHNADPGQIAQWNAEAAVAARERIERPEVMDIYHAVGAEGKVTFD
jgi:hypothetical protein